MRRYLTRRFCLLAAASAAGLAAVLLTPAAPVFANGTANFINWNDQYNKCLGIAGGASDADAVLWDCNGHPDQTWHIGQQNFDGYYQLINGDNQCLGVAGGSTTEGADIVGWTCNGHPDQYWLINTNIDCGGGFNPILNFNAGGYVVAVAGNSTANGAHIVIWPYQGKCNNQFWDAYGHI